jgi:hypothetical protein
VALGELDASGFALSVAGTNRIGRLGLEGVGLLGKGAVQWEEFRAARAITEPGLRSKVNDMSRNFILLFGGICWIGVAAVALVHLMVGDVVVPAGMAIIFVFWTGLRSQHLRTVRARVGSGRDVAEAR